MSDCQPLTLRPGPVLIFGGPYSNLAATRAMREQAQILGIPPANCICTGDVVAYCAQPEATIGLLREWGVAVVMGNCEESLGNEAADCGCGFEEGSTCSLLSVGWYTYAARQIGDQQRTWMRDLPRAVTFTLQGRRFRVIHGGVEQINRFVFPSTAAEDKVRQLRAAHADVVVGGHCGIPFGQAVAGGVWLNAGVIGMPANDGTRDGWYLTLTPGDDGITAAWHRLGYAAETEAQAMRRAGLDNGYAEALVSGLWPSMDVLPEVERAQRGVPIDPEPLVIK